MTEEYIYDPKGEKSIGDMRVSVYKLGYSFLGESTEHTNTYLCVVADGGAVSYVVFDEKESVPGDDAFTEKLKVVLGVNSSDAPTADMTPLEVVNLHLESMRTNNWKGWLATMTEEKQAGFQDSDIYKYLLSLEVHEAYPLTGGAEVQRQKQALLEGTRAEAMAGSEENIAFVYADFSVEYDPTKSPFSDRNKWVYTLYRTDEALPWLISDWGVGHFSIVEQD